jgi:hypothetical protein
MNTLERIERRIALIQWTVALLIGGVGTLIIKAFT